MKIRRKSICRIDIWRSVIVRSLVWENGILRGDNLPGSPYLGLNHKFLKI